MELYVAVADMKFIYLFVDTLGFVGNVMGRLMMTSDEAKQALKEGKKLKHYTWKDNYWYVRQEGEFIVDELGHRCPYLFENNKFEGWEIVE